MMKIEGRSAIVTGGGSGIGAACAAALREAGARVVTWGRREGVDVHCDITDEESVMAAVATTQDFVGIPTILVAAAGAPAPSASILDYELADWDRAVAVNLRGTMLVVREVSKLVIAAKLDGSFLIVSSTSGIKTTPSEVAYSSSKAALNHLTRVAALDLGSHGIRVNAVCPGPVATAMMKPLLQSPAYLHDIETATPLGRIGEPEDIARATLSVIQADWMTGQVIAVDGGESLVSARGRWSLLADVEAYPQEFESSKILPHRRPLTHPRR